MRSDDDELAGHAANGTPAPRPRCEPNINDLGLQADLVMWARSPIERRRILKLSAVGIAALLADYGANTAFAATGSNTNATATSAAACVGAIPQETAGPYPADGSQASQQNLNALALSGIVRQDIRTSLGTSNTAPGIPTTLSLTLIDVDNGCVPLSGYAVSLWHCDREGRYSMYSNGVTSEDYLRGVQQADANGVVTFTTIFPACYSGRWPHSHFEIYPSLAAATSASNAVRTTQLALPEDVCTIAYATSGYSQSVTNLARVTLDSDNVFGDGHERQVATVTGDPTSGYAVSLTVGVSATASPGTGQNPGSGQNPGGGPGSPANPAPSTSPAANPAVAVAAITDGAHDYFAETGHNLGGTFRTYWRANGGLTQFGLPLTEEFNEVSPDDGKSYTVQYFERARFEAHPENAAPYNVLLGRLGLRPRPLDAPAVAIASATYFAQTGHNLGGVFRDYWNANGGLAIFGPPTSEEFTETGTDGKSYTVQYFERNRFEYHPENPVNHQVLLGLLGRQELVQKGWLI